MNPILFNLPSHEDRMRACALIERLVARAGEGMHAFTLTVTGHNGQMSALLDFIREEEGGDVLANLSQVDDLLDLLSVAVGGSHTAGAVLRTMQDEKPDRLMGWEFSHGIPVPLRSEEMRRAHCTDPATGKPQPPQENVTFADGMPLIR